MAQFKGGQDAVAANDTLTVVSADGSNTTKYYLIDLPLDDDAVLIAKEGSGYTIAIDGNAGVISGIDYGVSLKEILENVEKPELATLNVIDDNGQLVSLNMVNYDTAYVDTKVSKSYLFEVIAQDGTTINYQLEPTSLSDDAFVTSSIFGVDQEQMIISLVPGDFCIYFLIDA